jgi:hypothetical protein
MTTDRNFQINTNLDSRPDLLTLNTGNTNQLIGTMDMLKRDRFELLSAYLDGEVTAAERREVEDWLANDPEIQRLYKRLLGLRQGLRTMPMSPAQQPVEHTIHQVYQRMHQRSRRRAAVWGGSAIAAVFIGAVLSVLPNLQSQMAQSPHGRIEPLMVALNDPVVEIPKAVTAPPEQPLVSPEHQDKNFN